MTPIRPIRFDSTTPSDVQIGPLLHWNILAALDHARRNPDQSFQVEPRGWGVPRQTVAKMFDHAPMNIGLPYEFMY